MEHRLEKIDEFRFLLPKTGRMRVPGVIYASPATLAAVEGDHSLAQVANIAALPGIVSHALAMPDIHRGYGAPIGAVAAFDPRGGVVAPGITGYDINCGVRLLRTNLERKHIGERLERVLDALYQSVPCGLGGSGFLKLPRNELDQVMAGGAGWAVRKGFGGSEDRLVLEEGGCFQSAAPEAVSEEARRRGSDQLGTLGSGNHFLEILAVERVYDREAAHAFRLFKGQVVIMIHTGSRGLGHQVAQDYLDLFAGRRYARGEEPPDRELVYAPIDSGDGRACLGAMAAAANFASANRQVISFLAGEALRDTLGMSLDEMALATVYDAAHNIARFEEHLVAEKRKKVLVHRKGAIRCFPAGRVEVPVLYAGFGHPVLVPGTMGTRSYVMVGAEESLRATWGSTAHGAGRALSRQGAARLMRNRSAAAEMAALGVIVRAPSARGLAEEVPGAYKDIDAVVDIVTGAGLARKVAVMKPLAVIKG